LMTTLEDVPDRGDEVWHFVTGVPRRDNLDGMARQASAFERVPLILETRFVVVPLTNSSAISRLEIAQRATHAQQNGAMAANVERRFGSGRDVKCILSVYSHDPCNISTS
jgi:hypothetical protein